LTEVSHLAVIVDKRLHRLRRRSSSAWAKYGEALHRISLAFRISRTSRSSAFSRSRSVVGQPLALGLAHPKAQGSVYVQPILPAMEQMAAHWDSCLS
jgi:hypothetical protein